jgi:hypothetical protein
MNTAEQNNRADAMTPCGLLTRRARAAHCYRYAASEIISHVA